VALPTGEEADAELHWYVIDAHGPLCDRRVICHVGTIEGAHSSFARRYQRQGAVILMVAVYADGCERCFSFLVDGGALSCG
jgi:hypothetical protein